MAEKSSVSIPGLVAIPALITLGITLLRLVGELQHWPKPWFDTAAGGGGAIVGISWLPIIVGPYFALKLAGAGEGPSGPGKSLIFAFVGLAVFLLGGQMFARTIAHPSLITLVGFPVMLLAAFVPLMGWRALGITLLLYALAARIPVLIVMYLAMSGNNGSGWGTHYDAIAPMFAQLSFSKKYFYEALLPQMTLWIGWTVVVGAVLGNIVFSLARLWHRAPQPST